MKQLPKPTSSSRSEWVEKQKNKRVTPKKHHPRQKDPYGNGDGDLFLKKKHHLDFVNVFPDMLLFFPGMLLFLSNFMFHPPANGW